jgi:hypothetical protein
MASLYAGRLKHKTSLRALALRMLRFIRSL